MKALSAPSSPRSAAPQVADRCAFSPTEVEEVKKLLELRVATEVKDVKAAEEMLANVFTQLGSTCEGMGAKVVGHPKMVKGVSRIRIELTDHDSREACRWSLVDRNNDYALKTQYNGKEVQVWLVRPRFEIARDSRLYDAAMVECKMKGYNPKENRLDRDGRLMWNGEVVVAHQRKETWAARRGAPA